MKPVNNGTQYAKILQKLKRKKGLTSLEAVTECGTVSLHRRLTDLREMGYEISDSWQYKYDKDGKVIEMHKVYRLCG